VSELPINKEKYDEFVEFIEQDSWKLATIEQWTKDVRLAGLDPIEGLGELALQEIIQRMADWISELRNDPVAFSNFNYRVDIPIRFDQNTLSDEDWATIHLFRCFQKVWLRNEFSVRSAKDATDSDRKHLKP